MTDTEINEEIAGLMGWELTGIQWVLNNRGLAHSEPTNYLDPKRLCELMDLAATMGLPRLWQIVDGTWMAEIELLAEEQVDVNGAGKTPSHAIARAIARAIVAHADTNGA